MENPEIWLRTVCRKNGLQVDDRQLFLLAQYVRLLLDRNQESNLISRKDEANVWENHILHSIAILFKISFLPKSRILDLGTGGGLPGIPLKILCPDSSFVLLDGTQKKIDAVADITRRLSLDGLETYWGRAEEIGKKERFYEKFDYVIARAVAPLKDLIKWSSPFLIRSSGGRSVLETRSKSDIAQVDPPALVTFKGGDLDKELAEAGRRHVKATKVINLVFNGSEQILATDKKIVIVKIEKGA